MIKPTVGRVVHFYRDHGADPQAAIIAHVWSDTCVNLAIFDNNGKPYLNPPTPVTPVQPDAEIPDQFYCKWMPYQIKKPTGSESREKEAGTQQV